MDGFKRIVLILQALVFTQLYAFSSGYLVGYIGEGTTPTILANYTGDDFCTFNVTKRTLESLRDTLSQNPNIIFLSVKFGDPTQDEYYSRRHEPFWGPYSIQPKNSTFDPYLQGSHWPAHSNDVWPPRKFSYPIPRFMFALVFKGRGRSLYTLPYTLRPLSMESLSPGVTNLDFEISFDPKIVRHDNDSCSRIVNASSIETIYYNWGRPRPPYRYTLMNDEYTWYSIQQSLIFGMQNSITNLTKQDDIGEQVTPALDLICQYILTHDLQISPPFGNMFPIIYITEAHCDSPMPNAKQNNLHIEAENHLEYTFYFNSSNRTAVIVAVMLSVVVPLLLTLFQRKNPPKHTFEQGYKTMLSEDTDLPIGVKHVLFYWSPGGASAHIVSFVRIAIMIFSTVFFVYPEFIAFRLMDDSYDERISLIQSMPFQICLLFYRGCFDSSFNVYMKIVQLSVIPQLVEVAILVLLTFCKFKRIKMLMEKICEENDNERKTLLPFHKLPKEFEIPKHPESISIGIPTLIYYAKWRINLVLNSSMWVNFIAGAHQSIRTKFSHMVPDVLCLMLSFTAIPFIFTYVTLLIIFNGLLAVPSVYFMFRSFKLVYLFQSRLITLFIFFFHSTVVFIFCCRFFHFMYILGIVVVLTFTGLVMNSAAINSYYIFGLSLLGFILSSIVDIYDTYYKLIKIILEKANGLSKKNDAMHSVVIWKSKLGETSIDAELFWHVVDRCQPLRMKVASVSVQIIVAFIAVGIGVHIIGLTNQLDNFSDISVALATLLAATVIPKVIKYTKSSASRKQEERLFANEVEKSVNEYTMNVLDSDDPMLDITETDENDEGKTYVSCYKCIGWCYLLILMFGVIVIGSFILLDINWFISDDYSI